MSHSSTHLLAVPWLILACEPAEPTPAADVVPEPTPAASIASTPTTATAHDGSYISWREHLIDDEALGGVAIRGADGSVMGDLDRDGYLDIVSVHESDTEYDGVADGHVRVAFGSADPDRWELRTLVDGPDAGAAEDAAIGDLNGDGWPDVVAACELGHLVYLENPGAEARSAPWARVIPPLVTGRGSFIRVFLADFNQDGRPEIVAANKGAQNPGPDATAPQSISWFELRGDPLHPASWVEYELARVPWPINSQPVDLDGDGDLDVLGGSVAESRVFWFENVTDGDIRFREHRIEIDGTSIPAADRPPGEEDTDRALVTGFNVDFADLNGDGRLDIVLAEDFRYLVWLEQPERPENNWRLHAIGNTVPDQLVGLAVADIDGDGDPDVLTGGYSRGPRDADGGVTASDPLGRLAWFENTGNSGVTWTRHDISRRQRGMFDKFLPRDMDGDGDLDFVSTRGNSSVWDGVFWLEQVRSPESRAAFERAREVDSPEMPLPPAD